MQELVVPANLDNETAPAFAVQLSLLQPSDSACLDFSRLSFVSPFGMVFTAAAIRQTVRKNRVQQAHWKLYIREFRGHTYAGHMGFFRAFGLGFGKDVNEAAGSYTYLPLTTFSTDTLRREAAIAGVAVGKTIELKSRQLAQTLLCNQDSDLLRTIAFCLREIQRNVVEHSNAVRLWLAAQYWPRKGEAEIVIGDEGVGITSSLRQNPALKVKDDEHALGLSVQPGVTSKPAPAPTLYGASNPWANSGFGLYVVSRLCQKGGKFSISSGSSSLHLSQTLTRRLSTQISGTFVCLRLHEFQTENLQLSLDEIVEEGEQIAQQFASGRNLTASKVSRLLDIDQTR